MKNPINIIVPDGAAMIAAERKRQVEDEGHSSEHDDKHTFGELAEAACLYAECAEIQARGGTGEEMRECFEQGGPYAVCDWPWTNEETGEYEGLKIDDNPIRNLVKAGSLIAAEIDRLQRQKEQG